jgi:hypothetical protein
MAAPIGWLRKLQTMTATMTPTTISAANWHGVDDRNNCVPSYRIAYTMKATSYMTVNSNAAQNNSTYQWEQLSIPVDQDLYAASFAVVSSSGRSTSLPFSNFAPARTSATR